MLMATAATIAGAYMRHDPTQTTLHALVARHLESFLAFAEERSGRRLPRYVVEEFHGYLRCAVLAHGFGRASLQRVRSRHAGGVLVQAAGRVPGGRRAADVPDRGAAGSGLTRERARSFG